MTHRNGLHSTWCIVLVFLAPLHALPNLTFAQEVVPHERPPVDPWVPIPRPVASVAGSCQSHVVRDSFRSFQVNVDRRGCNMVGDAANETSIAVDPTNPRKIVIGWRQFDSVQSNFRQPGWAYSHDGGHTWVFRGSLDPGVFGSDPVLAAGPDGEIYYFSINFDESRLFKTLDGGITWAQRTQVSPGMLDKPWMAVDRSNDLGRGNIYIASHSAIPLFRSTDGGETWTSYPRPGGGLEIVIDVGSKGTLYLIAGGWFSKSEDAMDPTSQPTWVVLDPDYGTTQQTLFFNWGGGSCSGNSPNPGGLIGQDWIVEGKANGATESNLYVLTHAALDATGSDPRDVMFVRSPDEGMTWDRPVVINDDLPRCEAWQWFAMMSVAPNGRIDAVWNDTRNTGLENLSELYYTTSVDGGLTWSTNLSVSPVFDSYVGWPAGQYKLGDYYHMVSDNLGVNVAYAATFNGEQDIFFLRIGPWDCNGNQIDDALDISELRSRDCNANDVPDECEYRADFNGDGLTTLDDFATFQLNLTGPGVPVPNDCTRLLDADHDSDIDLHDFYLLSHVFVAP